MARKAKPKKTTGRTTKRGRPALRSPDEISDVEFVSFLARSRSIDEIAKKFKISKKSAIARIRSGFEGHYIFSGPKNVLGHKTFLAVPDSTEQIGLNKRAWHWQGQKDGQPYGVITFPASFPASKIRIVAIDKINFGHPDHDEARFKQIVNTIATEDNTFCFFNGDIIAEVVGGRKEDRESLLLARTEELLSIMMPIKDKIMWAQQGCLEERQEHRQGFDPLRYFCERLKVPYFTEPVYIDIFWGKNLFTLWAIHGHSSAQTKGGKMNALRNPASIHQWTNFLVMGHIGDATWNREIKLVRAPHEETLQQREEYKVTLGSFIKYLGSRAAKRGHTPPSCETVVLYLYSNGNYHVKTRYSGDGSRTPPEPTAKSPKTDGRDTRAAKPAAKRKPAAKKKRVTKSNRTKKGGRNA